MIEVLRSTTVRLALAYAAVFSASGVALMAFVWWTTVAPLEREFDSVLQAEVEVFAAHLEPLEAAAAAAYIARRAREELGGEGALLLADRDFGTLAGTLARWPDAVREPGWREFTAMRDGEPVRLRALHVTLEDGRRLLVARDLGGVAAQRAVIVESLLGAAGLALILGFAGGALLRRALLARIAAISGAAGAIVAGNLSRRVPSRGTGDEFDLMAAAVNRLLAQIEQLVEGTRGITNAIAHDLRTPLTELRTRLEDLLRTRPEPEALYAEVDAAVADVDRLIGLFNALLRLAELDSGVRRAGFVPVDLARVAEDVVELYEPLAEGKSVSLALDAADPGRVVGDPALLAQAIGNLVDNAVKYTPAGGAIRVTLDRGADGMVTVSVADDGPGIADAEKPKVLERFYRGDAARGAAGSGLGLNLVEAVARLHDGALVLEDNRPGLRAVLRAPAA